MVTCSCLLMLSGACSAPVCAAAWPCNQQQAGKGCKVAGPGSISHAPRHSFWGRRYTDGLLMSGLSKVPKSELAEEVRQRIHMRHASATPRPAP